MRFDRDLSETLVYTGLSPGRTTVSADKKVAHRLSEISQCVLLHGLRTGSQPCVFGTCRGQLTTLLVVPRYTTSRPPIRLLLDRQVPYIPGVTTMLGQRHGLLCRRKQPIARHTYNVTTATDKSSKGEAASPPPATVTGIDAARASNENRIPTP
jgi:hypothetical protein